MPTKIQQAQAKSDAGRPSLKEMFERANADHAAGRSHDAAAVCRDILAHDDGHFGAWHLLGILALRAGEPRAALTHIEKAVALAPMRADCRNSLGFVLRSLDRHAEAEAAFQEAVNCDPDFAEAHYQLGNIYREAARHIEAAASYRRVLALQPHHYQAHNNLGASLGDLRRFEEAIVHFRRAAEIRPGYAEAYVNLGHALRAAGRPDEAESICQQALALAPGSFVAHLNRGIALQDLGRFDEALECFRRAKPTDADYPKATACEGILHLLRGNFPAGWEKYEARWRIGDLPPRDFVGPQWRGEPIADKTILLHAEQGFGDTIQFLRYLPLVIARAGTVIVEVQQPLVPLVARFSGIHVVARGQTLPRFDVQCPLLSLPLAFGTTLDTISEVNPYLTAEPERISRWRARMGDGPGLKIGIAWAGNPVHRNDNNRSIPIAQFAPLFGLDGVRFFSLQVGPRAADVAALPSAVMTDLGGDLTDFGETAAAIANLDLVIAADTVVVHLAGALGKPVWTMLPFAPDWRWLLARTDSPWYPTMTLYRQPRMGDWAAVIDTVRQALANRINAGAQPRTVATRAEYVALIEAANEHHQAKRHVECEAALRRALIIDPTNSSAWHVLALSRYELGEKDEAIGLLQKAIALAPGEADYHKDLGIMLHGAHRFADALQSSARALKIKPDDAATHNSIGATLAELGRPADAVTAYRRALELNPNYYECWTNLGHSQQALLKLDEAGDSYRRALGIRYDYVDAQCSSAMLALLRGDYANGFTQFEWRWRMKMMTPRDFPQPRWQGEALEGKTILLHAEQGFGDTLQTLRFVPDVAARGARVVLEMPQSLMRLATSLEGGGEIVAQGADLPQFDVHCAFMSLPRVLGVTLNNLTERPVPYLRADPAAIDRWARRLAGAGSGLKVALAWAGNPQHAGDRRRSIPIETLGDLVQTPGVNFYSIQVGERAQDLALLSTERVVDLAGELGNFGDTAATLANCDLVITVDSAVAHLAGSTGRPCWIMLPFSPDWRWLTERTDSPWYPSVRLFRQPHPGAWNEVVATVAKALAARVAQGRQAGPSLDAEKLFAQAMSLRQAGRVADAQALARQILASEPDHRPTLNLLAVLCTETGAHTEAADLLARLIEIEPDNAEAHYNFGTVLASLDRAAEAIEHYRRAIALDPSHAKACSNLAAALLAGGQFDEAQDACRRALAIEPLSASAHVNLGAVASGRDRLEEAAVIFRRAAEIKPDFAAAHFNLGLAIHNQGRPEDALAHYRRAIAIRPDYADAHMAEAFALLTMGREFPVAFGKFEWRWRLAGRSAGDFTKPQWRGEPLQGRTILLHSEQGFGDSIMLLRYVPMVAARGGRVVIELPRSLVKLGARIAGDAFTVVAEGSPRPAFDLHCPLMSLPLAFGTTPESIPAGVPYLRPEHDTLARWQRRLGAVAGLKAGIAWAGSPQHRNDRLRSIPLEIISALFDLPEISWFSLQVGTRSGEFAAVAGGPVSDLSTDLKDFSETGAAIANLDLVISVDTAVAHLAGALGKPVWILLPFAADWRWLLDRDDSPWYPTARLFRQSKRGDWTDVVAKVCSALRQRIDSAASAVTTTQPIESPALDTRYFAAIALLESGREADAEAALKAILSEDPGHAAALRRLAWIRSKHGNNVEAAALLARSVESEPQNAQTHNNLGLVLAALGRDEEAEACYRRSLALAPGSSDAHNNLGVLLENAGRYREAEACYRRAMEIAPLTAHIPDNLGILLKESGQVAAAITMHRHALALDPRHPAANSHLLHAMNYDEAASARAIFDEHCAWGRVSAARYPIGGARFVTARDPERRLRVGYVCGDLAHSGALFLAPLLEAHDKNNVEVFLYANDARTDATTMRAPRYAGHFVPIHHLSDEQATALIRKDRIDILVDLSGHTLRNRMMLFARKPAPIAVTWLGYPNSTGLPAMDYRFTDARADPPGEADSLNTERLVRLEPSYLCYRALGDAGDVASLPAKRNGYLSFGSFNQVAKLSPGTIALWARLLNEVPSSRLVLKARQFKDEDTRRRVTAAFAGAGIDNERLDLVPPSPAASDHLACYSQVDIALDPVSYNGKATTCGALWVGVPVVTLRGERHAARVGASIMTTAGLEHLIAETPDQYVAIAASLARDLDALSTLRASLRQRLLASPLCDAAALGRTIEGAYRSMWRAWCGTDQDVVHTAAAEQPVAPELDEALARRLIDDKSHEEAEQVLLHLLKRMPERGMAWYLLGRARHAQGDDDAAIDFLRSATLHDPGMPFAHNDLGILLQQKGHLEEAEACYRRAVDRDGRFAEAMTNLGAVLAARDRIADATAWYNRAIDADAEFAPAHNNLGVALAKSSRSEEAAKYHRHAILLKPDFAEAHYNLGVALQDQGRLEEALASYDKAIELHSEYVDAHWNRAFALLTLGRYVEGWREHEWRWRRKQQPPRSFPQPLWRGEPLAGKAILLHAEQGLGDTLQFMRYVPRVAEQGGRVILQVPAPLYRLATHAFADRVDVISNTDAPSEFAVHLPLLSLPLAFSTTLETIPSQVPYLQAAPEAARQWRQRLDDRDGETIRIGVVWAGSPQHKNDRNRSIALERLAPLFGVAGARWFSLQCGERAADLVRLPAGKITDLSDELTDFAETAAALSELDLVVSVDTAVAHLAGALARPVWLLLPSPSDWRWLARRDDSPWYPTARLFRQQAPGDWDSVIEKIRDCLGPFVAQGAARRAAVT